MQLTNSRLYTFGGVKIENPLRELSPEGPKQHQGQREQKTSPHGSIPFQSWAQAVQQCSNRTENVWIQGRQCCKTAHKTVSTSALRQGRTWVGYSTISYLKYKATFVIISERKADYWKKGKIIRKGPKRKKQCWKKTGVVTIESSTALRKDSNDSCFFNKLPEAIKLSCDSQGLVWGMTRSSTSEAPLMLLCVYSLRRILKWAALQMLTMTCSLKRVHDAARTSFLNRTEMHFVAICLLSSLPAVQLFWFHVYFLFHPMSLLQVCPGLETNNTVKPPKRQSLHQPVWFSFQSHM